MGKCSRIAMTLLAVLATAAGEPAKAPSDITLDNLQAAYKNECNARARYLAFARKADAEGYAGVASLFRAAARAEQIHADNHAKVIRAKGATPTRKAVPPGSKSTPENLKTAIGKETYERDRFYPGFVQQARSALDRAAARAFHYALDAEAAHVKLYANALANLPRLKGAKKEVYVCPVCGYTTLDDSLEQCPTCSAARRRFETIT